MEELSHNESELNSNNAEEGRERSFWLDRYGDERENTDLISYFKINYRLLKKSIRRFIYMHRKRNFTNVLYLTTECPGYTPNVNRHDSPIEYISEMRKQYPDINIRVLVPIIGLSDDKKISKKMSYEFDNEFYYLEKTSISFEFFAQNKNWDAVLYRYKTDESNVVVYGIFSPAFSYLRNAEAINDFEKSVLFMRAARIAIANLYKDGFTPNIVHSENIPFYLGAEFEPKQLNNIRVMQTFDNLVKLESQKQEPFWSVINMADKNTMKKICNDSIIRNSVGTLFSLPIREVTSKMQDCINLIYDNYLIFHKPDAVNSVNRGDVIFRHLNNRVKKIFPNLIPKDLEYYYPFYKTLTDCDFWAVKSETYYKDLMEKRLISPKFRKTVIDSKEKSGFLYSVLSKEDMITELKSSMYKDFDETNYREERIKNKKNLLKEFSSDCIKTNFVDETLFVHPELVKLYGYLDSFYDAPLLFANLSLDIFCDGVDILFGTILKLFERNKNVQIIINIENGMKNSYVKSMVDFLINNRIFMGRWLFIDGKVHLYRIFSGADIYMQPSRICVQSVNHLLGMNYGCVPVVSNAGSLNDSVIDIFDNILDGNGFKTSQSLLNEEENTNVYIDTLTKALELYNNNPASWNIIVKNCLKTNTGWDFDKLEKFWETYQNIL